MSPNVAVGVENLGFGVLFVAIGLLLVTGRVPMNRRFGFRFKKASDSHETWKKVNKYGGYRLIGWSAAMLGVGVLALFRPYEDNTLLISVLSFAPVLAIVRVVSESHRYTRRLSGPQTGQVEKAKD